MRVLIHITHPAHVHFFKHFIWEASERGHAVKVMATEGEISLDLLDRYEIDYELASKPVSDAGLDLLRRLKLRTPFGLSNLIYRTYRTVKRFQPDVIMSIGGTAAAHVSTITDTTSVIFYDTEHAVLQNSITYPFSDIIYTPDCYQKHIGSNQVRYPGYQELAYLHPNRFEPDPAIKEEAGLRQDERYIILRLVSWEAVHDIGDKGFDNVETVVHKLEDQGVRVLITSEAELPSELKDRRVGVPSDRMHDLMYYADLFIGESATMATESAVLGTPAIFVSSSRRGYTDELEEKYGLVFNFSENDRQQRSLEKALSILDGYDPETWSNRRERMLNDKIDTTEMMLREILETQRFRDRKSDTS